MAGPLLRRSRRLLQHPQLASIIASSRSAQLPGTSGAADEDGDAAHQRACRLQSHGQARAAPTRRRVIVPIVPC
jgi:hypothetical protein